MEKPPCYTPDCEKCEWKSNCKNRGMVMVRDPIPPYLTVPRIFPQTGDPLPPIASTTWYQRG